MKSISVKEITNFKIANQRYVIFIIDSQTHRGHNFAMSDCSGLQNVFAGTNILLQSQDYPDYKFDLFPNVLYVRGSVKEYDKKPILVTDEQWTHINEAIAQYNNHFSVKEKIIEIDGKKYKLTEV